MRKLVYAAFIGGLFTIFGGSIYLLFSLFDAAAHGKSTGDAVASAFFGSLLCWAFFTYVFYQVQGMFDEMNEAGRREAEEREKREHPAAGDAPPGDDHNRNNTNDHQ